MKANIDEIDLSNQDSSLWDNFHMWPGDEQNNYLMKLKGKFDMLRERKIKQKFNCDILFTDNNADVVKLLQELSFNEQKDMLDVCLPSEILDRIKNEDNLKMLENLRRYLLTFYRSYYPANMNKEERNKALKDNVKVKELIKLLNEYMQSGDISNSKRFLIDAMITNLDGTIF